MRLIRENVEREASGATAEKLIMDGFSPVKASSNSKNSEETSRKNVDGMTLEELKALAKEKGLTGVSSLAKADLLAILKG